MKPPRKKNSTGKNRVPNIVVYLHQNTRLVAVCCIEDIDANDYTTDTIYMHSVHHSPLAPLSQVARLDN